MVFLSPGVPFNILLFLSRLVRTLQSTHCLTRSRHNKNQFEIVENIEYDKEKLQKTFAELKIDDIKAGKGRYTFEETKKVIIFMIFENHKKTGGWISTIVRNPLEQTIGNLCYIVLKY